ncbi:MAG: hypothetical protein ACM3PY_13725 [Omnitrophica WOR_2 bacterium]
MTDQPFPGAKNLPDFSTKKLLAEPSAQQVQAYQYQQLLYLSQTILVQRFIAAQARQVIDTLSQGLSQIRFSLPDAVVCNPEPGGDRRPEPVPAELRHQFIGGFSSRFRHTNHLEHLRDRLDGMEKLSNRAAAISAQIFRHSVAVQMIYDILPSGHAVQYEVPQGEEIPSIPIEEKQEPASALTASSDAIALAGQEEGTVETVERGELLVPYVPAARRFYLPQWVAFDENDQLLAASLPEARAQIASMQRFLSILYMAIALAPYMSSDEEFRRKRDGMLGQLINQGRALARYVTADIIKTIHRRASENSLNRGLSLTLPYFDDEVLQLKMYPFTVIPGGRIMFIPSFVVISARKEQEKVSQNNLLSASTRMHLMGELVSLEKAFTMVEDWEV